MKPRTIFRLVLVVILIALFVRNYLLYQRVDHPRKVTDVFHRKSRDLGQDDLLGGHTLKRHVGKSDAELRARLDKEQISAASTYTDRQTAERTVQAALMQNEDKLHAWLTRPGPHQNLVLDYDAPDTIGRTLRRGASTATDCSHAVVVLSHIEAAGATLPPEQSYYVLTSYPQCGTEKLFVSPLKGAFGFLNRIYPALTGWATSLALGARDSTRYAGSPHGSESAESLPPFRPIQLTPWEAAPNTVR